MRLHPRSLRKPRPGKLVRGFLLGILAVCQAVLAQDTAPAAVPREKSETTRWRQDLRFLADEMPKHHRNLFHTMTREQFEASVKRLDERIPALARHQIIIEMARIVAMVGDGHTNISPTRDPKIGFRSYPVKLYLFKDGLYVRAAARESADLVGARVVKIGRTTAEKACDAVREIIGRDNEMDARFFAPFLLTMPEVLHALGLIEDMESAPFLVESRGQRRVANLKPAGPAEMMAPDTDASWLSGPNRVDARDGAKRPVPLWLRDPQNKFWFEYLADARAVYVQYNQVGNKEDETIEAFAKRLFAFVEAKPVERLVLDLRLNRGGNGALNRPLLLGLIRSTKVDQKGRLFTIIGRSTWSAAQGLVNELERYTNTTFVGEPTGGKTNSYGDSHRIALPNSGITVRVSTLWWQGDERDRRPWTGPEVAAELTFEDYRTNNDPALNAALRYVPGRSLPELLKEALSADDLKLAAERDRQWRADPANAYFDTEVPVNSLGYELMAAGRLDQAIEVFSLNAAAFPHSANAWDSLGEAYRTRGDKEAAIRSYQKALELNPNQGSAIEALRILRGR
jgi:tetratricopeptide (TPR) repeat protein